MHVVFLNPQGNFDRTDRGLTEHPDFGGQLVYVKETALAMGNLGHQVDIITRQIIDPQWPEFAQPVDHFPGHENVRILRFPCGPKHFLSKEQLWPYIKEWTESILRFYKRERTTPDGFTGHYGDGGLAAALLAEKTEIPFTFTGHSLGAQKMEKMVSGFENFNQVVTKFRFDKRIAAERIAISRAARIISSTDQERFKQYGHHLYSEVVNPGNETKFAVIPPGVNLKIFGRDQQDSLDEKIAKKINKMMKRDIPSQRRDLPVVICSSRLDRKKNHIALVRAWAESESLRNSANLAIIVRGTDNPLQEWENVFKGEEYQVFREIVEAINSNNLYSSVTLFDLNSQKELASCYRYLSSHKQGIFALTAFYEPFGLAPLEAMAAGLPAVVTKNGGPSESLQEKNREFGILVDPEDPLDIANGITQLSLDYKRWKEMQGAGIQRIREKYTWEKTAEGYLREIQRLKNENKNRTFQYPIPSYFRNPENDDINQNWLANLFFKK